MKRAILFAVIGIFSTTIYASTQNWCQTSYYCADNASCLGSDISDIQPGFQFDADNKPPVIGLSYFLSKVTIVNNQSFCTYNIQSGEPASTIGTHSIAGSYSPYSDPINGSTWENQGGDSYVCNVPEGRDAVPCVMNLS